MTPAPSAALQNTGTLILGDHALYLQQQVVLGRAANRPVQEHHFHPSAAKFLDQQHLVGIAPREPIRGMHVDPIDLAARHGVS